MAPRPPIHLATACVALVFAISGCGRGPWVPADGDVVFQVSRSAQSAAIQRATGSRWSHVGIVFHHDEIPWVLEAAATVRAAPLDEWLARGDDGHYVATRLRYAARDLGPDVRARMAAHGLALLGRPYDPHFRWSDDQLYCSELVWKLYADDAGLELCPLRRAADYRLDDPEVLRLASRRGGPPPADEPVIAPSDLLASPLLVVVGRG
jgi:hypothetical protein